MGKTMSRYCNELIREMKQKDRNKKMMMNAKEVKYKNKSLHEEYIQISKYEYEQMLKELDELRRLRQQYYYLSSINASTATSSSYIPPPLDDIQRNDEFIKWKSSADPFAVVASSPHCIDAENSSTNLSSRRSSCNTIIENSSDVTTTFRRSSMMFSLNKPKLSHLRSVPLMNKDTVLLRTTLSDNSIRNNNNSFRHTNGKTTPLPSNGIITTTTDDEIERESDDIYIHPLLTEWNAELYQKLITISAFCLLQKISLEDENNFKIQGNRGDWLVYDDHNNMCIVKNEQFKNDYKKKNEDHNLYEIYSKPVYAKRIYTRFAIDVNEDGEEQKLIHGSPGDWVVQDGDERRSQRIVHNSEFTKFYIRANKNPAYPNKSKDIINDIINEKTDDSCADLDMVHINSEDEINAGPSEKGYPSNHLIKKIFEKKYLTYLKQYAGKREFDVFAFSEYSRTPLRHLGIYIVSQTKILQELELSEVLMSNYLYECGLAYLKNPYHNALHATDVMNGVASILGAMDDIRKYNDHPLELLSVLIAAAIHDIGHPGTTNQFQVQSCSDLAIQYNDASVLENFHCALGFRIMRQQHCAVLSPLKVEDFQYARKCIIQCVLATDLSIADDRIKSFGFIVQRGYQKGNPLDRKELLKIVLSSADLNHPTKEREQHLKWSSLVLQEFSNQITEETTLSLPVSISLDLTIAGLAKSQIGFIKFIVMPVYEALGNVICMEPWINSLTQNLRQWEECMQRSDSNEKVNVLHSIFDNACK